MKELNKLYIVINSVYMLFLNAATRWISVQWQRDDRPRKICRSLFRALIPKIPEMTEETHVSYQ
jgi:hypothetical protein